MRASFYWDSANTYINHRAGTNTQLTLASLSNIAPNNCTNFYFEVEVTRTSAAYATTRRYHITVTGDGGISVSTPTPRELYVERLISQSRNSVADLLVSSDGTAFASISAGGTTGFMVGNTYWIKMIGSTATQGYNQAETFVNLPNTTFQVLSVTSTYSAGPSPTDRLYADSCGFDNDPQSPTYRSCVGSNNKAGGQLSVTYKVRILGVPAAPLPNPGKLSSLVYDFSGSSYHYNADFDASARFAKAIQPTLTKAFSPKMIAPGGPSTLTFVISNPGPDALAGLNFSDVFPAGMALVSTSTPTVT